ncbi:MAG: deoxyribonuclease IV [Candidatus Delongbacteria bacterium]|nr:deoxyribonuclease IV [Candidatus Delongbacteria bacterium]MBN2835809.1 deoxyribonuclease IV [Candidatus Delongbacteria bacterium]
MKYIGAHVSISGGVFKAPMNAFDIGAKAFAMFTKNQRRWESKPYSIEEVQMFKDNLERMNYKPKVVLPHDGYLINLGNPDNEKHNQSLEAFIDEAKRVELLGLELLNFHPGSHLNEIDELDCLEKIAKSINEAIKATERVRFVIETTAGQGTNLGYKFEQIAKIIKNVDVKDRVGVCIDTCHIYAAGYDISSVEGYNETFMEFESLIGFDKLMGVHLNDSKSKLNSRVDRHHSIGKGFLGEEFFIRFMNDPRFDDIPIVLETIDETIWKDEINYLYSLIKE